MRRRWNVNLHYDETLADLVPAWARTVLDVGCGDGFLAARLSPRVRCVVGLDLDAPVLERARTRFPYAGVGWVRGDLTRPPFRPGSFDAVLSNATLHHVADTAAALRALGSMVAPGGTLGVVGFVRTTWRDLPYELAMLVSVRVAIIARGKWEHSAPIVWPPVDTWSELRRTAAEVLPGSRLRRLLYGRVLLTWTAPR